MAVKMNSISFKQKTEVEWKTLLNLVYPIGSFYITTKPTSPASLFGGTWSYLRPNTFICNGPEDRNGGSLTEDYTDHINNYGGSNDAIIPKHTHKVTSAPKFKFVGNSQSNHSHSFSLRHSHYHEIGDDEETQDKDKHSLKRYVFWTSKYKGSPPLSKDSYTSGWSASLKENVKKDNKDGVPVPLIASSTQYNYEQGTTNRTSSTEINVSSSTNPNGGFTPSGNITIDPSEPESTRLGTLEEVGETTTNANMPHFRKAHIWYRIG